MRLKDIPRVIKRLFTMEKVSDDEIIAIILGFVMMCLLIGVIITIFLIN